MIRPWKIATALALGLLACRESAGPSGGGTGGLGLDVVFPSPPGIVALDSGYVRLTGPRDTTVKAVPGTNVTIEQLPPGTYTVALEGFSGGAVSYFGQTTGVQVTVGQNKTATVTFSPFVSAVNAVPRPARRSFNVTFGAVTNAASYEVEAASDSFFTTNRVTVPSTTTSARVRAPTYGTYFIRVRAIDPYSARGRPSPFLALPVTGALYIINDSKDSLEILDPVSLAITPVGPLGVVYDFGDCAWNPVDTTLYMVEGRGSNGLYKVNLTTGAATLVGVHGIVDMFAIGYHPPTNTVYGISSGTSANLYRLNLTTGAATLIGAIGFTSPRVEGLIWDAPRNRFVGETSGTEQFYTVNVTTGAATSLGGSAAFISDMGMTYDPALDRFWAVDYSGSLFRYDPLTFARTPMAANQGTHTCIAHVP